MAFTNDLVAEMVQAPAKKTPIPPSCNVVVVAVAVAVVVAVVVVVVVVVVVQLCGMQKMDTE